jgi:hypothetical protein
MTLVRMQSDKCSALDFDCAAAESEGIWPRVHDRFEPSFRGTPSIWLVANRAKFDDSTQWQTVVRQISKGINGHSPSRRTPRRPHDRRKRNWMC